MAELGVPWLSDTKPGPFLTTSHCSGWCQEDRPEERGCTDDYWAGTVICETVHERLEAVVRHGCMYICYQATIHDLVSTLIVVRIYEVALDQLALVFLLWRGGNLAFVYSSSNFWAPRFWWPKIRFLFLLCTLSIHLNMHGVPPTTHATIHPSTTHLSIYLC